MPQILKISLTLAVAALAGPAWGQPPFPIAYAADPVANCALPAEFVADPLSFQNGDPDHQPTNLPAVIVPVGGPPMSFDLCFLNWSPSPITGTGTPCLDGTGPNTCALKFVYATNGGITIQNVSVPPPVSPPSDPKFPDFAFSFDAASPTTLSVMGGNPIDGQNGDGVSAGFRVATVTLLGVATDATFRLVGPTSSTRADEMLATMGVPDTVIATTVVLCGNNVLDTGEECDDDNLIGGDGCFRDCRLEDGFSFDGQAGVDADGKGPSISFAFDGFDLTFDLQPNVPADDAAAQVVATMGENPTYIAQDIEAVQAFANDQPPGSGESPTGKRVAANAALTGDPILSGPTGSLVVQLPEPGVPLMLVFGIGTLLAIGRKRIQP